MWCRSRRRRLSRVALILASRCLHNGGSRVLRSSGRGRRLGRRGGGAERSSIPLGSGQSLLCGTCRAGVRCEEGRAHHLLQAAGGHDVAGVDQAVEEASCSGHCYAGWVVECFVIWCQSERWSGRPGIRRERTKAVCDQVQCTLVLLHHISVQSSQVETVENVVLVHLCKVLLLVSDCSFDHQMVRRCDSGLQLCHASSCSPEHPKHLRQYHILLPHAHEAIG